MNKILVIGDGDSIFVKDFINQYIRKGSIVDLISFGSDMLLGGVRKQKRVFASSPVKPIYHFQSFKSLAKAINDMDDNYNSIIIHYVNFNIAPHIYQLKKKSQCLVAMVWGSDFYRMHSKIKIFFQNIIYRNVDKIVFINEETKYKFLEDKKFISERKLEIAGFGLPVLGEIDALMPLSNSSENIIEWCHEFDLPYNKIKVMVGYNANLAHNQLKIIDEITHLSSEKRDLIHLVFPLSYGGDETINLISNRLKDNQITNYTILSKFYNFEESAKLRMLTDVLINIQPTDQLSATMKETLYAGGAVIAGAWLPYSEIIAKGANIYLIDSPDDIGTKLDELLNQPNTIKNSNLDGVRDFINESSSWIANLRKWDLIMFEPIRDIKND